MSDVDISPATVERRASALDDEGRDMSIHNPTRASFLYDARMLRALAAERDALRASLYDAHAQIDALARSLNNVGLARDAAIRALSEEGRKRGAAEAERDAARAEEWQPIETAPKDRQIQCGHSEKKWLRYGRFHANIGRWYYSGTSERSQYAQVEGDAPTHWMPLPVPPMPEGE